MSSSPGVGLAVHRLVGAALVVGLVCGCASLRQNLRNQFVSFRGTWACNKPGCTESQMQQSRRGHNEGDLRVSHVKLQPQAALVFYPGTPVQALTATLTDCKGRSVEGSTIKGPGTHKIKEQAESWIVVVDQGQLSGLTIEPKGACATLKVITHATWDDGSTYDETGAIQLEG